MAGWLCHPWVSVVLQHGRRGQAGLTQPLPRARASSIPFCIQGPLEVQSSGFLFLPAQLPLQSNRPHVCSPLASLPQWELQSSSWGRKTKSGSFSTAENSPLALGHASPEHQVTSTQLSNFRTSAKKRCAGEGAGAIQEG